MDNKQSVSLRVVLAFSKNLVNFFLKNLFALYEIFFETQVFLIHTICFMNF